MSRREHRDEGRRPATLNPSEDQLLQTVIILKAIVEVALCAFFGQGILYVLAGSKRHTNFVYGILKTLTAPVFAVARFITPRVVLEQHLWLVSLFLLVTLWVGFTVAKVNLVLGASASGA